MKYNLNSKILSFFTSTPIMPILVVGFVAACLFVPNFASVYNQKILLLQASDLLIISCGVTFVVLNGGIDFSATSVLTLGSVVGAYIMALSPLASNPIISIPVAIAAILVIGLLVGAINGFAITVLKMPSFIATLTTQLAVSGVAVLFNSSVTEKSSISGLPESFFIFGGSGKYYLVPIAIALLVWGFSYWLLKYTKFGRDIYAIGVNPRTAHISGINVKKTIFVLLVMSGLFAGIASILATARNQVGLPSLGDKMFISIMAAIIVGGTSTAGGFGGFKQTLLGVLFVTVITNIMNLLGVEWFIIMIIQGTLILLSTMFGTMFSSIWSLKAGEESK